MCGTTKSVCEWEVCNGGDCHRGRVPARRQSAELFRRWRRSRDRRARDELIERFLPLARKLARRYVPPASPTTTSCRSPASVWSRRSSGSTPTAGSRSPRSPCPRSSGELKRYFRDTGWALHVDRGAQERARKIDDAQHEISGRTGRCPRSTSSPQYLELSEEEVLDGLQTAEAYDTISLDAPVGSDDDGTPAASRRSATRTSGWSCVDQQATIFAAAKYLPERERQILFLRFGEDLTQSEIAERIGVSQMQVSRLLRRSLKRLRDLTDDHRSSHPEPLWVRRVHQRGFAAEPAIVVVAAGYRPPSGDPSALTSVRTTCGGQLRLLLRRCRSERKAHRIRAAISTNHRTGLRTRARRARRGSATAPSERPSGLLSRSVDSANRDQRLATAYPASDTYCRRTAPNEVRIPARPPQISTLAARCRVISG